MKNSIIAALLQQYNSNITAILQQYKSDITAMKVKWTLLVDEASGDLDKRHYARHIPATSKRLIGHGATRDTPHVRLEELQALAVELQARA